MKKNYGNNIIKTKRLVDESNRINKGNWNKRMRIILNSIIW